jgi:hypothetical protein
MSISREVSYFSGYFLRGGGGPSGPPQGGKQEGYSSVGIMQIPFISDPRRIFPAQCMLKHVLCH